MPNIVSNTIQLHIAVKEGKKYKYLVLRRAKDLAIYPGLWQVVTGTIENNESAVDTVKREINEETKLALVKLWTIPFITSFYNSENDVIHLSPVFGAIVEDSSKIILSDEHDKYLWLTYKKCLKKLDLPSHINGTKIFKNFILNKLDKNKQTGTCLQKYWEIKL